MSEEKVKQHYVPCCYLANFGIDGNQKRKTNIYAYDATTYEIHRASVETFAYSNNFYDLDNPSSQKLLENIFMIVEGDYSAILKQVIALPRNKTITKIQKEELSAHFAIQYVRTQAHRDLYDRLLKQLTRIVPEAELNHYYKNKKEYIRVIHTKEILSFDSIKYFANMFTDRIWIIWRNETETPFYTSDNPVCTIFHGNPHSPIAAPDVEIYVPISPTMAISAYDKSVIDPARDRSVAGIRGRVLIDGYNINMEAYCTRFVFSNGRLSYQVQQ